MDDKPKHPGGRPKKEINLKLVESLAIIQCTDEEMAACLGISVQTITRKKKEKRSSFVEAYKRGKEKGKTSLRRLQWKAAQGVTYYAYLCDKKQAYSLENKCDEFKAKGKTECLDCVGARYTTLTEFKGGATGMQIWLGKQWLGQKDKAEHELSGKDGGPIKTESKVILYLPDNKRDGGEPTDSN